MTAELATVARPEDIAALPADQRGALITPTPIAQFATWAATQRHIRPRPPQMAPAVYLTLGNDNTLLYVGFTTDLVRRLNAHRHSSHWRPSTASATWQNFSSTDVALSVERWLIATYQPSANVQHRNGPFVLAMPDHASSDDWAAVGRLQCWLREHVKTAGVES